MVVATAEMSVRQQAGPMADGTADWLAAMTVYRRVAGSAASSDDLPAGLLAVSSVVKLAYNLAGSMAERTVSCLVVRLVDPLAVAKAV